MFRPTFSLCMCGNHWFTVDNYRNKTHLWASVVNVSSKLSLAWLNYRQLTLQCVDTISCRWHLSLEALKCQRVRESLDTVRLAICDCWDRNVKISTCNFVSWCATALPMWYSAVYRIRLYFDHLLNAAVNPPSKGINSLSEMFDSCLNKFCKLGKRG